MFGRASDSIVPRTHTWPPSRSVMIVLLAVLLSCASWVAAFHDDSECAAAGSPCAICLVKASAWLAQPEDHFEPPAAVLWMPVVLVPVGVSVGTCLESISSRGPPASVLL